MQDRTCSIDGCERDASGHAGGGRGWCPTHYMRWRRTGSPDTGGPIQRQTGTGHPCPIPECSRPVVARNLCERHYRRLKRYGSPTAGRISPGALTDEERFWAKVNKTDTCWLWTDAPNNSGYGTLKVAGESVMAHRYSLALAGQELNEELTIDHLCRVTLCVNPEHLEEVTYAENLRRAQRGPGVEVPPRSDRAEPRR